MVVIEGLVAFYGDEVLLRVSGQFAVEVGSRDDGLLVLGKSASGLLHDAEGNGHDLVESLLVDFECLLVNLVNLIEDGLALVEWCILDGGLEFCYLFALFAGRVLYVLLYFLGFGA